MLSEIVLSGVWKFYDEVPVLKNLSLTLEKGNIYVVQGPNGSGKTTLLSLLCGRSSNEEGSITYAAEGSVHTKAPDYRHMIDGTGADALYEDLSVYENLEIAAAGYASFLSEGQDDRPLQEPLADIVERFGLQAYADKRAGALSSGNRQRLFLSRIFLCEYFTFSPWLLLDEPDVFLDQDGIGCLTDSIIASQARGGTCIISSHNRELVDSLSCKRIFLTEGLVQENAADE
jgi:ABC-type multidrug transport system ATPase subunit